MEFNKKNYMYILNCLDNTLYTGYTNDLIKRLKKHNEGKGAKYTKSRSPVTLVYYEEFETKSLALKKEIAIKKKKRIQKIDYINQNITDNKKDTIKNINKILQGGK